MADFDVIEPQDAVLMAITRLLGGDEAGALDVLRVLAYRPETAYLALGQLADAVAGAAVRVALAEGCSPAEAWRMYCLTIARGDAA